MPRCPARGHRRPELVIRALFKFGLRWGFRLGLLAVAAVALVLVFRDLLLRAWVRHRIEHVTGLDTQLGGLTTDIHRRALTLHHLLVLNAPDFGGSPLLRLSELHLELDTEALARREFRLRLARVQLEEFDLVRNARGETNLHAILGHANTHATPADAAVVSPPGLEFTGIERLDLTFGTLRYLDLAQPALSRDIRVGLTNEILQNVRSAQDFTPLLLRLMFRELGTGLRSLLPGTDRAPSP